MAELLISGGVTRKEELRSLIDRLDAAIPAVEPVEDDERIFMLTLSTSASAYETREPGPDEPAKLGPGSCRRLTLFRLSFRPWPG